MPELIVHHLPGAWGLPSVSPFCLKLDTYLRIVDLPFEVAIDKVPFGAPKKKLPYIEHRGRRIGDSAFAIDYLESEFDVDGNAGLSAEQRAVALALQRLLEENLYWAALYDRWMVDDNWRFFRDIVLGGMPLPIRRLAGPAIRRSVGRRIEGHGIGVHSESELHAIGIRDLGAVADYLGDKPFLMGNKASTVDAAAYGLLANILLTPIVSPIKQAGLGWDKLVAYLQRMQATYFAEGAA